MKKKEKKERKKEELCDTCISNDLRWLISRTDIDDVKEKISRAKQDEVKYLTNLLEKVTLVKPYWITLCLLLEVGNILFF